MIGVLGLQGDFAAHLRALEELGVEGTVVKKPSEFEQVAGLILPGGESTTLTKLMDSFELWAPLRKFAASGKPVFGTCAGMIMLARQITNPPQKSLGLIDLTVERNSYGRQRESFETTGAFTPKDRPAVDIPMIFIRAPRIVELGDDVEALATCGDDTVMARQQNVVVASFHPELTSDREVHRYFVEDVLN